VTILLIATLVLPRLSAEATELNNASAFRISETAKASRFVLDLTQKPEYIVAIRKNPLRLVIEIQNTTGNNIHDSKTKNFNIKSIRRNRLSNNKLQIVLDLKHPIASQTSFVLPPKNNLYRLVVDITPQISSTNNQESDSEGESKSTIKAEVSKKTSASNKEYKEPNNTTPTPVPHLKEVKKTIIAIDAGHGGHDPGTTGYNGSQEKNITLDYAFTIKQALESTDKYEVILTRKDDNYIDLKKRVEIAHKAKADMFISIHADSHNNHQMSGLSIYTLSEKASDKEAEELAQKENNAGVLNDVDVKGDSKDVTELLIDLVQRQTKNLSAEFAENILKETRSKTEILHNKPHRFAGFRVLTGPDIPSVLIELGYLSNQKEETLLLSENHKNKLAEAIVKAIDKHFKKYPVN